MTLHEIRIKDVTLPDEKTNFFIYNLPCDGSVRLIGSEARS